MCVYISLSLYIYIYIYTYIHIHIYIYAYSEVMIIYISIIKQVKMATPFSLPLSGPVNYIISHHIID